MGIAGLLRKAHQSSQVAKDSSICNMISLFHTETFQKLTRHEQKPKDRIATSTDTSGIEPSVHHQLLQHFLQSKNKYKESGASRKTHM